MRGIKNLHCEVLSELFVGRIEVKYFHFSVFNCLGDILKEINEFLIAFFVWVKLVSDILNVSLNGM